MIHVHISRSHPSFFISVGKSDRLLENTKCLSASVVLSLRSFSPSPGPPPSPPRRFSNPSSPSRPNLTTSPPGSNSFAASRTWIRTTSQPEPNWSNFGPDSAIAKWRSPLSRNGPANRPPVWPPAPAHPPLLEAQQTAEAIKILTEHVQREPDDGAALAQLAALQPPTDALPTWDHLIELAPSADHLIQRAFVKRTLGDYPGAIADARTAAKFDPEQAASLLPPFERLEAALVSIERLDARLATNPGQPTHLLLRSHFYLSADLPTPSLADAERALALAPGSFSGLILRDRALSVLGQLDEWAAREQHSVEVNSQFPSDRTAAALIDLDVALVADPGNAQLLADRAALLNGELAQYRLALIAADQALAVDPRNPRAALAGILAATLLSDSAEATARLRSFEATKPDASELAEANAFVADACFKSSDIPLALAFADRSLTVESSPRMIQLKAGCLQRLGRGVEAQALLNP